LLLGGKFFLKLDFQNRHQSKLTHYPQP